MKMNWNNCFSEDRYGVNSSGKGIRSEFEVDWDRIIFSSPFRRLQNKTQVFPLPDEVFVHNRLTHSLEVASVGRSLGAMAGRALTENIHEIASSADVNNFYLNDLKHVIAAACLAHDMGNPAFGHSGEEAISKYFIDKESSEIQNQKFLELFTDKQWNDLTHFEGNANALRVLTKQQNGRQFGGYRLTYSTLGSIIKYPCESLASQKKGPVHRKKYGFFEIDRTVFTEIAEKLNMVVDEAGPQLIYKRHPFVFLVEAADDICYNIIDYEDAHRLKILTYDEVEKPLLAIIESYEKDKIDKTLQNLKALRNDKNEAVAYLRAKSINCLTNRCADVFIKNQDLILSGNFNISLMDGITELKDVLAEIGRISRQCIYNHESVVRIELAGFHIMSGLIEDFVEAALTEITKRSKRQEKTLNLLPTQFKLEESSSPYAKVIGIIDCISGMTDLYALKLYRNLRGIEMPHI
jgi:dGTPase